MPDHSLICWDYTCPEPNLTPTQPSTGVIRHFKKQFLTAGCIHILIYSMRSKNVTVLHLYDSYGYGYGCTTTTLWPCVWAYDVKFCCIFRMPILSPVELQTKERLHNTVFSCQFSTLTTAYWAAYPWLQRGIRHHCRLYLFHVVYDSKAGYTWRYSNNFNFLWEEEPSKLLNCSHHLSICTEAVLNSSIKWAPRHQLEQASFRIALAFGRQFPDNHFTDCLYSRLYTCGYYRSLNSLGCASL